MSYEAAGKQDVSGPPKKSALCEFFRMPQNKVGEGYVEIRIS
jgi:hypothetical protein